MAFAVAAFGQGSKKPALSRAQVFTPTAKDIQLAAVRKIPPLALPDGRMLIAYGDTVSVIGADGRIVWKYSTDGVPLTGQPAFNAALNEIAVIGFDLTFVRLNADTGERKWNATVSGGAVFTDVRAFGRGYLLLTDMEGYRQRHSDPKERTQILDTLEYWDETLAGPGNVVWSVNVPTGADLFVSGPRIFAVSYGKGKVTIREIQVSRDSGSPR